jgi:hypothetical protein
MNVKKSKEYRYECGKIWYNETDKWHVRYDVEGSE